MGSAFAVIFFSLLVVALILGVVTAAAHLYGTSVSRRIAATYTTIILSIPDLCLLLLIYFGGQELLNFIGDVTGWWRYLELHQITAAVLTLGALFKPIERRTNRHLALAT